MSKRKKIIILILVLLNLYFWSVIGYSKLSYNTYKPKEYEYTQLYNPQVNITLDKSSARKLISKLVKTPHTYKEKQIDGYGRSIILYRKVEINTNLDIEDYVITYTHELMHIKYCTENETWVSYKTFKTLYESENAELKYIALNYANKVLSGYWQGTEYDCGYYILKYLNNKGELYANNVG